MDKVRGLVHGEIRSRVRLVYDPPPEEQRAAKRALFNLLSGYDREWDLGEILENDAYVNFKSQSTLSREFLLEHCVGPLSDRRWINFYTSVEDSVASDQEAAELVIIHLTKLSFARGHQFRQ